MPADRSSPSTAEVANEYVVWAVGLGIVSFALFPFLLPGIAILAVFALPLLAIPLVVALPIALVAAPVFAVRAVRRRRRRVRAERLGAPVQMAGARQSAS
jgi:Flp pilus assembly protein TadB